MSNIDYSYEDKLIRTSGFHYMLPAIVGLVFGQISPIIGGMSIARSLGEVPFSALSTIEPINLVLSAIGVLGGVGCGITVSKCSGSGDKDVAARVFTRSIIAVSAVTIILSVVMAIFADPILLFLRATPENLGYAREYLYVTLAGSLFIVIFFACDYIFTDDNDPNIVLFGSVTAAAVNIGLNVLLLDILHWGIWASAFATVFSQLVGCLIFTLHFRKKDALCRFVSPRKHEGDPGLLSMLKPGTPMALMYTMFAVQMLVQNVVLSGESGTSGLGNSAVIDNLVLFLTIFTASASEPVMPLASSYFGEENKCGMLLVKRKMYHLGLIILAPIVLLLVLFPQLFMALFSVDDPVMLESLPFAIRIVCLNAILTFTNDSMVNYLSATEREHLANISYGIQLVINIVATLVLAKPFGMDAPWYGAMAATACAGAFLLVAGKTGRGFVKRYPENALALTGGQATEAQVGEWLELARTVLSQDEVETVQTKLTTPFLAEVPQDASPTCSFTILERDGGDKAAIIRYTQKFSFFSAEGGSEEDEEALSHVYGECIRSEFNTLRRMMVNLQGSCD